MKEYAFIFDMDGVIVDSNPYHKISLNQFCKKYGYALSDEELLKRIYGRTNKEWIVNLFGPLPAAQLAAYAYEKESLYREVYQQDIQPVAGLVNFLEQLEVSGIRRAIGTSAPRENVDFTLTRTGTSHFFPIILDESHIAHGKPNPEIYIKVAAALGLPPSQCVVIEDSLSGITAGQQAGAKVIGITTTHTADELKHTDLVISDFNGLSPEKMLNSLFGGN